MSLYVEAGVFLAAAFAVWLGPYSPARVRVGLAMVTIAVASAGIGLVMSTLPSELPRTMVAASGHPLSIVEHGWEYGARLYEDRAYTFQYVPDEVRGSIAVRTWNADKGAGDDVFVSLALPAGSKVFVAVDERLWPGHTPSWLVDRGFERLNGSLGDPLWISTSETNAYRYALYVREYRFCERIQLPGPAFDDSDKHRFGGGSMYLVGIKLHDRLHSTQSCPPESYVTQDHAVATCGRTCANTEEARTCEGLPHAVARHDRFRLRKPDGARLDLNSSVLPLLQLNHVDLVGADLTSASMPHAHIDNAWLGQAELAHATLDQTVVSRTSLAGATLSSASLRLAKLTGVDLTNADLTDANLEGAQLSECDLTNALFEPRTLPDARAIASSTGLSQLRYERHPAALVALRRALLVAAFHGPAREVLVSINRQQLARAGLPGRAAGWIFDAVAGYGAAPLRPLSFALALTLAAFAAFVVALAPPRGRREQELASAALVLTDALRLTISYAAGYRAGERPLPATIGLAVIGWTQRIVTWTLILLVPLLFVIDHVL